LVRRLHMVVLDVVCVDASTALPEVPVKSSSMKERIAVVLAEKFLKDLENSGNMDSGLVKAARPAVIRLFKDLPEDRQALLMYLLKRTVEERNDDEAFSVEQIAAEGALAVDDIDIKSLEKVKQEVQYIHGVVASTLLVSYGGLGEERIAVEG
jgi:hypothetical protein